MNTAFSTILPNLQFAWDSTSLSAFKTCPRLYYYSIVLGYQPKQRSFHLTFGILYHSAMETYAHARASGLPHDDCVREVVAKTLRNSWDAELGRPNFIGDQYKNRFTLVRAIVWYLDQFQDDAIETVLLDNGKPAVELSFRFEFPHTFSTGEEALLCGHLDKIGSISGQFWIVDHKTTKHALDERFFGNFSPDNQMSCYSVAGKVVYQIPVQGVIVNGAQMLVNGSRFARGFAPRTDAQLDEWLQDTAIYIAQAETYAKANYWPQNDKSCFNYGGCAFRGICARSPEVREIFLEKDFNKRTWDPLQIRGDV